MPILNTLYGALTPDATPFDWSRSDGDIEVDPMLTLPDGGSEPGSPPEFFSVFAHFAAGGRECLSDHTTLARARRAAKAYKRGYSRSRA